MADIKDLLERADALPAPLAKTREELVRDLEWSVEHAEEMARSHLGEAAYRIALGNVEHFRQQLAALPPPERSRLRLVTDDETWEEFVDEHPELTAPPEFSDDELVEAVKVAIAKWDEYLSQIPNRGTDGAVWASLVALVLAPDQPVCVKGRNGKNRPSGWQLRVAARLRRLAASGRIVRFRSNWGGAHCYSLAGVEIGDYISKGWVVDDA